MMDASDRAASGRPLQDRDPSPSGSAQRSSLGLLASGLLIVAVCAALAALGTWQIHRLAWKNDLLARVGARAHAPAVPIPGPEEWPAFGAAEQEYRHVVAHGTFLNDRETFVQAVTGLGGGYWVLTPFRTDDGFVVLINRGFVPPDLREPARRAAGQHAGRVAVTGLLRITERQGTLLQSNDPASDLWYARDVAAIAATREIGATAPYFVDADATPNSGGYPVGGLTVLAFTNNHLVYALTWYMLAVLLASTAIWMSRHGIGRHRSRG